MSISAGAQLPSKPASKIHAQRADGIRPALALTALGVVFGDIGTSPLYTLKTCFTTAKVEPNLENVLARNSRPLPDDLEIRPERRVELGIEVAI